MQINDNLLFNLNYSRNYLCFFYLRQVLPMNACNNKELPCFLEFLSTCTQRREEDLVYGIYCLRHTNATHRTFAAISSQTSVDMQPISLRPSNCESNMFLWSFLTKVTYARAKELISFMNIDGTESSQLARFIMAISEPVGERANSEEMQRLRQYLSAYCQSAISCLESSMDRDKILVPIIFSSSFYNANKGNNLIADIIKKAEANELSVQKVTETTKQIFVPLTMLNLLDQINLLSFRMFCGLNKIALAPNVSIACERLFIGSGLSVRNALTATEITKLKAHYPDSIYRLILNVHGDTVHSNYDILVLFVVPKNTNLTISPQIFIAKRKYISSPFDIEKLDMSTLC